MTHVQVDCFSATKSEEVVQVYRFCIHTLCLPVISIMIIGVMRLSYERAVPAVNYRLNSFIVLSPFFQ